MTLSSRLPSAFQLWRTRLRVVVPISVRISTGWPIESRAIAVVMPHGAIDTRTGAHERSIWNHAPPSHVGCPFTLRIRLTMNRALSGTEVAARAPVDPVPGAGWPARVQARNADGGTLEPLGPDTVSTVLSCGS